MDLERAKRLMPLVTEGFADSLAEAATRFAITHGAMGTILVGMATIEQFQGKPVRRFERPTAASGIGPFGRSDGWLRGRAAVIGLRCVLAATVASARWFNSHGGNLAIN